MKAKDLMIGDWVSYNGTAITVENIHDDCINFVPDIPYVQEEYMISSVDIEPIKLTAEILEKNGFKGRNYCYLKIDDFSYLEYYSFEHRLRRIYNGVDEWENHTVVRDIVFQCHCTYVHELQHALKLCGIEKEIEL